MQVNRWMGAFWGGILALYGLLLYTAGYLLPAILSERATHAVRT